MKLQAEVIRLAIRRNKSVEGKDGTVRESDPVEGKGRKSTGDQNTA
jgi:hypothetical protein